MARRIEAADDTRKALERALAELRPLDTSSSTYIEDAQDQADFNCEIRNAIGQISAAMGVLGCQHYGWLDQEI